MTSFVYHVTLSDSETIALNEAIDFYLQEFQSSGSPRKTASPMYIAMLQGIRDRVYEGAKQVSGHEIDPVTGEYKIWVDLGGRNPNR